MTSRRHRRERRRGAKLVAAQVLDSDSATTRFAVCACPAVLSTRGDLTVVERYHHHGCPQLRRMKADGR